MNRYFSKLINIDMKKPEIKSDQIKIVPVSKEKLDILQQIKFKKKLSYTDKAVIATSMEIAEKYPNLTPVIITTDRHFEENFDNFKKVRNLENLKLISQRFLGEEHKSSLK